MKKVFLIILPALMSSLLLTACGKTQPDQAIEQPLQNDTEVYVMETEKTSDPFAPSLQLDTTTKTFVFRYSVLSSYLPSGQYEIADGILTAKTEDGQYKYVFEVVDDSTLKFLSNSSSSVVPIDEKIEIKTEDGACFIKKEDR